MSNWDIAKTKFHSKGLWFMAYGTPFDCFVLKVSTEYYAISKSKNTLRKNNHHLGHVSNNHCNAYHSPGIWFMILLEMHCLWQIKLCMSCNRLQDTLGIQNIFLFVMNNWLRVYIFYAVKMTHSLCAE